MEQNFTDDGRPLTHKEHQEIKGICGTERHPTKFRKDCEEAMKKVDEEKRKYWEERNTVQRAQIDSENAFERSRDSERRRIANLSEQDQAVASASQDKDGGQAASAKKDADAKADKEKAKSEGKTTKSAAV